MTGVQGKADKEQMETNQNLIIPKTDRNDLDEVNLLSCHSQIRLIWVVFGKGLIFLVVELVKSFDGWVGSNQIPFHS